MIAFVQRPCRADDARTFLGEQSRDFLADAPTGAGHDGDAAVQLAHAAFSISVVLALFSGSGSSAHLQPFGRIAAQLRRRPGPMGLRFGELENRAEMPQWAAFRPTLDADRVELSGGQVQTQPGKRDLALAIDEHARLAERHADVIAAAVSRPLRRAPEECRRRRDIRSCSHRRPRAREPGHRGGQQCGLRGRGQSSSAPPAPSRRDD